MSLYDRHVAAGDGSYQAAGTDVLLPGHEDARLDVVLPSRLATWQDVPTFYDRPFDRHTGVTRALHVPVLHDLAADGSLLTSESVTAGRWWNDEVVALVVLVHAVTLGLFVELSKNWISLTQYGYLFLPSDAIEAFIEQTLDHSRPVLETLFPGSVPAGARPVLDAVRRLETTTWPVRPGPILRRADGAMYIVGRAATGSRRRCPC